MVPVMLPVMVPVMLPVLVPVMLPVMVSPGNVTENCRLVFNIRVSIFHASIVTFLLNPLLLFFNARVCPRLP